MRPKLPWWFWRPLCRIRLRHFWLPLTDGWSYCRCSHPRNVIVQVESEDDAARVMEVLAFNDIGQPRVGGGELWMDEGVI